MPAKYGKYGKTGMSHGKSGESAGNGSGNPSKPSMSYGKGMNVKETSAKKFVGKGRGY